MALRKMAEKDQINLNGIESIDNSDTTQYDKFPVVFQFDFIKYHKMLKKYLKEHNISSVYQIPKEERWKIKGRCYVRDKNGKKIQIENIRYHRYCNLININKFIYSLFSEKKTVCSIEVIEYDEENQNENKNQLTFGFEPTFTRKKEFIKKPYTENELIFYPDSEELQAELLKYRDCNFETRLKAHINYLKLFKNLVCIMFWEERVRKEFLNG